MNPIDRVFGYVRLRFPSAESQKICNLLFRIRASYTDFRQSETEGSLCIRARDRAYVSAYLRQEHISCKVGRVEGLPRLFVRYVGRKGIFVGVFLAVLIVILSSLFAFDIRIEGNERISDAEILTALEQNGVEIGGFLPTMKLRSAANKILIASDEIGFFSLRRQGNVIYAKVLEKNDTNVNDTLPPSTGDYANLVASEDAVVLSFALVRGKPALRVGQTVRKGELLASGVLDSGRVDPTFVCAEGEVIGRVSYTLYVEVPLEETVLRRLEAKTAYSEIIFFGKRIKFSKDTRNLYTSYDTIESKERLSLFGLVSLPIFLNQTLVLPEESVTVTHTETEAARIAYARMENEIARVLAGGTLLARESEGCFEGGTYRLTVRIDVAKNIARSQPFEQTNQR